MKKNENYRYRNNEIDDSSSTWKKRFRYYRSCGYELPFEKMGVNAAQEFSRRLDEMISYQDEIDDY